jgi:ABC-type polysaccharide/polyol phosphate transport system ATPase subunit
MTTAISIENVSKCYRLGTIGGGTLAGDLNRWWARLRNKPDPLLRVGERDFGNRQGEFIWALRDVSFDVQQGGAVGIIGRNGAGKSTLLKILSRVTAPTSGLIKAKGRVASLLEVGTGFHPELTGRENIYLNGAIMGMSRAEVRQKLDEIVDFSGVEQFIDTPVKRYSSGMYVRLAFAVAAHLEPEILLVDEVLAVGDINFQKKCLGKMGDVARAGRTVVLVSHQLNQIRRLCHRVVWIDGGEVSQAGPSAEVVSAYETAMSYSERGSAQRDPSQNIKARFLSWRIADPSSTSPHRLDSVGPVSVSFKLEVLSSIRHAQHGIALFDAERRLMWAFANEDLTFEPGIYELVYKFPFLPLCPKSYNWQLSLWDDSGNVDLWDAVPEIQSAVPNYQHARDEWNGFLNIPSELTILNER